ncbi:MAG: hypothetical protein KAS71_13445 [Bacteroidales bacterium]|nr:hypothetical protein [Bacteroidales bacterium]
MKILTDIQELNEINGGQITSNTSGQYDIGYLLGRAVSSFIDIGTYLYNFYPYYY